MQGPGEDIVIQVKKSVFCCAVWMMQDGWSQKGREVCALCFKAFQIVCPQMSTNAELYLLKITGSQQTSIVCQHNTIKKTIEHCVKVITETRLAVISSVYEMGAHENMFFMLWNKNNVYSTLNHLEFHEMGPILACWKQHSETEQAPHAHFTSATLTWNSK